MVQRDPFFAPVAALAVIGASTVLWGCGTGSGNSLESTSAQGDADTAVNLPDDRFKQKGPWLEDLVVPSESNSNRHLLAAVADHVEGALRASGEDDLSALTEAEMIQLVAGSPSYQLAPPEEQQAVLETMVGALEEPGESPTRADIKAQAITVPDGQPSLTIRLNKKGVIQVLSPSIVAHTMGLKMRMVDGVGRIVLDRGVYSNWHFVGSNGRDSLVFGPQGTIINKTRGGVVDFGVDSVSDSFVFKNVIDVDRCSEKHGYRCHPLNHLQRVTIKNFGPEDKAILQGKTYTIADVQGEAFRGVPIERLRVQVLKRQ